MTDADLRARAIALYDRYTHTGLDRRALMTDLVKLAGSAVAANALLLAIAADPAAAAIVPADDEQLDLRTLSFDDAKGLKIDGYVASLKGTEIGAPVVLVVHENRGLTEHIRDVARRVALEGYVAIAPDFLTRAGGTPADENLARESIGKLDLAAATADGIALVKLQRSMTGAKIGVTGFCWGGAMANRIAVGAGDALAAAAPYYGPAPDPSEAAKVKAAMLLHYAENDPRVNATAQPWIDALKAAKADVEAHFYVGAEHAFNNDTSAARYNKAAADLAWGRTLAHFKKHLAA